MELSDMEKLWKEHDKKLEYSIRLNEKLLKQLNFDKAVDEFTKLINLSVLGRNLAFIYFLISFGLSITLFSELRYSIPGFVGGLLMLWSFIFHLGPTLKLKRLNFNTMPVIELQKVMNRFKIYSFSAAKYDFTVVVVWILTIIPLYKKIATHKDLYVDMQGLFYYLLFALIIIAVIFPVNNWLYQRLYVKKLDRAESQLNEILEFEKQVS